MTVRMVLVGRAARRSDADQASDVGDRVGDRVKPVRDDAQGTGQGAQDQLGGRDRDVEEQDAPEGGGYPGVAIWGAGTHMSQNSRAAGSGHQRSWTFQ